MMQAQEAVSRVKVQNPRTSVFPFYFGVALKQSSLDEANADFSVEN